MLELLATFVVEVIFELFFYTVGRWLLLVLSCGQFDTRERSTHEGLVVLLGGVLVIVTGVLIGIWLSDLSAVQPSASALTQAAMSFV